MTAQTGDTFEFKRALRRELRLRRVSVSAAARRRAAVRAADALQRLRRWRSARHVALYLAVGSELPTMPLIEAAWQQGKHVYVPHVDGDGLMHFVELRAGTRLRANRYGIPEPVGRGAPRPLHRIDLLIAPLVGFDARGYRLGAGGGFYDRVLARRIPGRPLCLGWAFAIQQVPSVPRDPWDQRLDGVVTDRGLRWPIG